jgi:tetratricopeptide (TPR) repeat protein
MSVSPLLRRLAPLRRLFHSPAGLVLGLALAGVGASAVAGPVVAPTSPVRQGGPAGPAQMAYDRGIDAMVRQDWAAAERAFLEALKQSPQHVDALLGLAELAFRKGQVEVAGKRLDEVLAVDGGHAAALAAKGRQLALQGKLADAEQMFRRAAERDPKAVRPRIDLADQLASRGDHRQAIELYRQVLALDGNHAGARFAYGISLREVGQRDAAVRELQAAIALAPEAARAHVELSRTEFQRRRYTEALAAADAALALKPPPVEGWLVRADALEASGRIDEALRSLASAATAAPRVAMPHLRTGMIEQQRGQLDAASRAYRRALEIDRRQPVALNNLAVIALERKSNLAEAEGWALEATRLNPRAAQLQHTLGDVLRAQGKRTEALAAYEAAARLLPGDATLVFHHGRALAEAGQAERAREVIRGVLDRNGNFAEAAEARRLLGTL